MDECSIFPSPWDWCIHTRKALEFHNLKSSEFIFIILIPFVANITKRSKSVVAVASNVLFTCTARLPAAMVLTFWEWTGPWCPWRTIFTTRIISVSRNERKWKYICSSWKQDSAYWDDKMNTTKYLTGRVTIYHSLYPPRSFMMST